MFFNGDSIDIIVSSYDFIDINQHIDRDEIFQGSTA